MFWSVEFNERRGADYSEPDAGAALRPRFAVKAGIDPGHDLEQAGLARTVKPEHADFGAGEEGQADVAQDDPLGRDHL